VDADLIRYERRGRVAVLTLDRPPVNALSFRLYEAVQDALQRLADDEKVHAAVLTSATPRAFCAGADIHEVATLDRDAKMNRASLVLDTFMRLVDAAVPMICAMNGPAIGAGLLMAACCDFRVIVEGAHVRMPEIDRGAAGGGGAVLRRLGLRDGFIRDLYLSGRRVGVDEALAVGLVDLVVPPAELMTATMAWADRLSSKSRTAVVLMKQALNVAERHADWREGHRATDGIGADLLALPESRSTLEELRTKRRSYTE